MQARKRQLRLGFGTTLQLHAKTCVLRKFTSMVKQCTLTDAGLPAHNEHSASPGLRPGEEVFDDSDFLVTPQEVRQHRSDLLWVNPFRTTGYSLTRLTLPGQRRFHRPTRWMFESTRCATLAATNIGGDKRLLLAACS